MTRNAEAHGPSARILSCMVLEAEAEDNPAGPVPLPAGLPVPEALAAQSGALPQGSDMLTTFLSLMPDAAVAVDGKGRSSPSTSGRRRSSATQPKKSRGKT